MVTNAPSKVALTLQILDRVEQLILDAEQATRPLEMEPFRSELFNAFVLAEAGGLLNDNIDENLTADELCRKLATRWGLANATQQWFNAQSKLSPEHMQKMRSLWGVLRMWMEWTYAWKRWGEFHTAAGERKQIAVEAQDEKSSQRV